MPDCCTTRPWYQQICFLEKKPFHVLTASLAVSKQLHSQSICTICWNAHLQIIQNFWNIVKAFNVTKGASTFSTNTFFFFVWWKQKCTMGWIQYFDRTVIQTLITLTLSSLFFTLNRVSLRHTCNANNCSVGDSQVQSQSCYLAVWVLVVKSCCGFLLCARILITLATRMHSFSLCFRRRLSWLEM